MSPTASGGIIFGLAVVAFCGFGVAEGCSGAPQRARAVQIEAELCRARADYKLAAVLAGGRLDPTPGSPRATLEQAEDALCLTPAGDAGP